MGNGGDAFSVAISVVPHSEGHQLRDLFAIGSARAHKRGISPKHLSDDWPSCEFSCGPLSAEIACNYSLARS